MTRERKQAAVETEELGVEPAADGEVRRLPNNVRKIREAMLMSKAELARESGLSALTIDRVESGHTCRMDTKRKIILALGLKLTDKDRVFGDD